MIPLKQVAQDLQDSRPKADLAPIKTPVAKTSAPVEENTGILARMKQRREDRKQGREYRKEARQAEKDAEKAETAKMKKGGIIKKSLKKAQDGKEVGPYIPSDLPPKSKDKRTYSGPLAERDTKALDERYPSTVGKAPVMKGRGTETNPISSKGVEAYYRKNDENYLRSGTPEVQKWNASPKAEGEFYPTTNKSDFKKGGAKKTITMKKMKTGGMVNSNAKVSALKSAGSKGVKSGMNPKAKTSNVAKGKSGGTNKSVPRPKKG